MSKKVFIIFLLFLIIIAIPAIASTGIDYLKEQPLEGKNVLDSKVLSMLVKTYSFAGNDTTEFEAELSTVSESADLIEQGYILLATKNSELANSLVSRQEYNGSWNNDIYTTALLSYVLLETNLGTGAASSALNYLWSMQNEDGGWGIGGSQIHETALALLALTKGGYNGTTEQKALDWLLLQQGGNGSWGSNFNTAWTSLVLMEKGLDSEQVAKVIDFFRQTINRDGGWGIYPGQASDPFVSGLVLWVLQKYNNTFDVITDGLAYISNMITNKVWIHNINFYVVSEMAYTLQNHPEYIQIKGKYESYLSGFIEQNNFDAIARRLSYLAYSGQDIGIIIDEILQTQNQDGGWGFEDGFESNSWDTILVLRSLLDANYTNLTTYTEILNYLQTTQNSDGSYSVGGNGEGHLYLTTLVVEQLVRLNKILDTTFLLNPARNWLISQRDGNGGYGGSLLENARVFAVTLNQLSNSDVENTLSYFAANKEDNGSWNNDFLTTAAVLAAFDELKPDLSIDNQNITFTPEEIYSNDQVTIGVMVENTGYLNAENVEVSLYYNSISDENLLSIKTITEIMSGENQKVDFTWKSKTATLHKFVVLIDQGGQIEELEENNNMAARAINVIPKRDLTLAEEDILITPEDPGPAETLTISAMIHNNGSMASGTFDLAFYNGDPQSDGTLLETVSCSGIEGYGNQEIAIEKQLPEGNYDIYVILDTNNTVQEDIEDNNITRKSVSVLKRIDMAVSYKDIFYSNDEPLEGDVVIVYANIVNKREEAVNNVTVSLYLGNPDIDGRLIETKIVERVEGNASKLISWNWDTSGLTDRNILFVVIDPENTITEVDESNNKAINVIHIYSRPDLIINSISTTNVVEGQPSSVSINIKNQGGTTSNSTTANIYLESNTIKEKILEVDIPSLQKDTAHNINLTIDTVNMNGNYNLYVEVDPDNKINESKESNNEGIESFSILSPPELMITSDMISFEPVEVYDGDEVQIQYVIKNISPTGENVKIRLSHLIEDEWQQLKEQEISIDGNSEQTLEYIWDSNYMTGANKFRVDIDPEKGVYEHDKSNNIAKKEMEVKEAIYPDLTISKESINTSPDPAARDSVCTLKADILNLRPVTAENLIVKFYNGDPDDGGTLIGEKQIRVPGRNKTSVEVNWDTNGLKGYQNIYVLVDPDNLISEYNNYNNIESNYVLLKAGKDYQPENLQAVVNYKDVELSWDSVEKSYVNAYLLYRDGKVLTVNEPARGNVLASSRYGSYIANNAIDGDKNTRWVARYNTSVWFEEEFADFQYIKDIEINWYGKPLDYNIQVWDGEKYITVAEVKENIPDISFHKLEIPVKRYRINLSKEYSSYVGIYEVHINVGQKITNNSYVDLDLISGEYTYNISSINTQGEESVLSESVSAKVLPPAAPTDFIARVSGPDVELSWQASPIQDLHSYKIRRNGKTIIGEITEINNGIATASGYHSSPFSPDKAVDDREDTRWHYYDSSPSVSDEIWWQYEFPEERYLFSLGIEWSFRPESYKIMVWKDEEWIQVFEETENILENTTITFPESYKTDKFRIILPGGSKYYGIWEMEIKVLNNLSDTEFTDKSLEAGIYEYQLTAINSQSCESEPLKMQVKVQPPEVPENLTGILEGNNVNLAWEHQQGNGFDGYFLYRNGKMIGDSTLEDEVAAEANVTVSSVYGNNASYQANNVIDRTSNRWYSGDQQYPAWIMLEFGEKRFLSGIRLDWYSSTYSARDYSVQYRVEDKWLTIETVTNNQQNENYHQFSNLIYTDAVRVYCENGNYYKYITIDEVYLYEVELIKEMSYIDQGLLDGRYTYQVAAVDSAQNISQKSNTIDVSVGDISSPKNLTAIVSGNEVFLNWDIANIDNILGYRIFRNNKLVNKAQNVTKHSLLQASVYNSSIDNISDGDENSYWYCYSSQYPVTINIAPEESIQYIRDIRVVWRDYAAKDYNVLAQQDGLWKKIAEVRNNTDYINEISMNTVEDVSQIKLEIIDGPYRTYLAEFEIYDMNFIEGHNYVDKVIKNGLYQYYVRAISNSGNLTAGSNRVLVEVNEMTAPVSPDNFRVEERSGSLLLQWNTVEDLDLKGYNIYLGKEAEPLNSKIIDPNSNNYSFNDIEKGIKEYKFAVEAVDVNYNSSLRSEAVFKYDRPKIVKDINVNLNKLDINLNYQADDINLVGCKLYRNGNLLNTLSKIKPTEIEVSSFYYQNNNYLKDKVDDNNLTTYWKPDVEDNNPLLELKYNEYKFISAVKTNWHNNAAEPENYSIQAWIDDSWVEILNQDNITGNITVLSEIIVTNQLRMVINSSNILFGLSEFAAYRANLIGFNSTYTDSDLSPGIYQYEIVAVNKAGLESDRANSDSVEITKRDLSIEPGDLLYTPYKPSVFDNITFTIKVTNSGNESIENISIGIYAGDPSNGGTCLDTIVVNSIGSDEEAIKQYIWDPTGYIGDQKIYVEIDPDNSINEYDETNNNTSIDLTISENSVLETLVNNIDNSEFPLIKLGVKVNDTLVEGVAGLREQNFVVKEDNINEQILNVNSVIDDSNQLALIDLVFIIDTSGSMYNEWDELPQIIQDLTDTLTEIGINFNYKVFALGRIYKQVPNVEAMTEVLFRDKIQSADIEDWGPGTAWVAKKYNWLESAYRIIIPISDENCYHGGSSSNSTDIESLEEATRLCKENNVEVYPFYGTGSHSDVLENMQYLAENTGGERFFFRDANQVVNYLSRELSQKKVDYYLEYETSNQTKDGTLRDVVVETRYRNAEGSGDGKYRAPQDIYSDLDAVELVSDSILYNGQQLTFIGTIENNGGALAENITVDFYLGDPGASGILLDSKEIKELDINTQSELTFNWTAQAGTHDIYMVIDPEDNIVETDETNNTITVECNVPGQQYPDLYVDESELLLDGNNLFSGQQIKIQARIRNIGSESRSTVIGFYEGNPAENGELISTVNIGSLPYLGYKDIETYWIAGRDTGEKDIYVIVDPLNTVDESNEENNIIDRTVTVSQRDLRGEITTDSTSYRPDENVEINIALENHQDITWTGGARVVIKDERGNIIEELAEYDIGLPAAIEGGLPGLWQNGLNWNTGNISPGTYLACLRLYVYQDYFAEFVTEFTVIPDETISGSLFSDKMTYRPGDEAVITVDYENTSINTNLESLALKVEVIDDTGKETWLEQTIIPYLSKTQIVSNVFYWPVEQGTAGEYIIKALISSGESILWSESIPVMIEETAVLGGRLNVDPDKARKGEIVELSYNLENTGNIAVDDLLLRILFLEGDALDEGTEIEAEQIDEIAYELNKTHNIALDETIEDSFSEEIDLTDGRYMLVMQAVLEEEIVPLDNGVLTVDSTAPVTEYELTEIRCEKEGILYGTTSSQLRFSARDNLLGVAQILYKINDSEYIQYPVDQDNQGGEDQGDEGQEAIVFTEEGIYSIKYKSIDIPGNEEEEQTLQLVIDDTPPSVNIESPSDGEQVLSEFEIDITVEDNIGIDSLELYLDNEKYADYSAEQIIDSQISENMNLDSGTYTLKARAVDQAGYESWTDETNIEVIQPKPELEIEHEYSNDLRILILQKEFSTEEEIGKFLKENNISYRVVSTIHEFNSYIKTNQYNLYLLIDDSNLSDLFERNRDHYWSYNHYKYHGYWNWSDDIYEMTCHLSYRIYNGQSLLYVYGGGHRHFLPQLQFLQGLLGVNYRGYLSPHIHQVEVDRGLAEDISFKGKALKLWSYNTEIEGKVYEKRGYRYGHYRYGYGYNCYYKKAYPVLLNNHYGRGTAYTMAFNPFSGEEGQEENIGLLITSILNKLSPESSDLIEKESLFSLKLKVENTGNKEALVYHEMELPEGFTPVKDGGYSIDGNKLVQEFTIEAGESIALTSFGVAAEIGGEYQMKSKLYYYNNDGERKIYEDVFLNCRVE